MQLKTTQQMKATNLTNLSAYKTKIENALEQLKSSGASEQEIDTLSIHLAEIDEIIESKSEAPKQEVETPKQSVKAATKAGKKLILEIYRGKRFNQVTGKEESTCYKQTFTYAEALLFVKNYKQLGFTIAKVINNPFDNIKL